MDNNRILSYMKLNGKMILKRERRYDHEMLIM